MNLWWWWFYLGWARFPCCAGSSPVVASRVTLQLRCTGSSLQRLPLQWSRGPRARGLPCLQRVASAVVTKKAQARWPSAGMTWPSSNTRLPCPASWREAACPQEPLFLPCQSLIAAGPPGGAHLTWAGSTLQLSPGWWEWSHGTLCCWLHSLPWHHLCVQGFWVMEVDNVLVSSPGIELVGFLKNVRILYLLVTSALRL